MLTFLGEPGPLEPKKWTQTPPPKPRPSNAQLPQQQLQPALAEPLKPQAPQQQAQPSNEEQLNPKTTILPQVTQTPAERATAKALKFAPAVPSGLRNMTKMSPLQIQQEQESNKENYGMEKVLQLINEPLSVHFSKEVLDELDKIPQEEIVPYPCAELYEGMRGWTEAEKATDPYFT
jgi:hypothetical protein